MRQHPAMLRKAGISPARYKELKGICQQYPEHIRELRRLRAGIVDRPNRRLGYWHAPDPTGNAAQALADSPLARRVQLIEQCAASVAEPVVARAILRAVTEGTHYARLDPPIGERQFNKTRMLFYIELDRRLWEG